jgi:hypothetical protein
MGRIAWVCAVGLALAGSAAASEGVEHEKLTVGPDVIEFAAGEACEFAARVEQTAYLNQKRFYDEAGTLVRELTQVELVTRVVNVATGYALDERDNFAHRLDHVTGEHVDTGQVWHVRDAEGNLVYTGAGRFVMDADGNVLEATPNTGLTVGLPQLVSVVLTYCELLAAPVAP